MKLTAQKKLKILNQVLKDRKSVTSVCAEAGIARKTFYQWKKRYQQAPNRIKKQALQTNYASGKHHPKNKRHQFKDHLISIVVHHPSWGSRKISAILCRAGFKISNHAVYNLLKDLNLETKQKREEFSSLYQTFAKIEKLYERKPLRFTPESRKRIVEEVVIGKKSASNVCRKYHLSRKTFYKWLARYQEAKVEETVLLQAMRDNYVKGFVHPRSISEKVQEQILHLVRQHPEYSTHKVGQILAEVGNHGVQNVFQRLNLNTYEKRLAYTEAYQPVTTAPRWVEGIRTIFGRIPVISAIPPPTREKIATAFRPFVFSFLSSIVLSTIFIYWLRIITQAPTLGAKLGLFFASTSLLIGGFFFAYSMKYYLTLAIVLSFSRQTGEEGIGVGLTGEVRKNGNGGWLTRIFGLRNGGKTDETARLRPGFGGQAGGLQPSLDHIKLKRYPFVSIHLPFYNERKVAERILKACVAMDYPHFEVVVIDDSTDETTKIVERFAKKHNKIHPHGPKIKVLHRPSRKGFKGGALGYALKHVNPKTEFVVVFDADFIPYPDTLELFIKYFQVNGLDLEKRRWMAEDRRQSLKTEGRGQKSKDSNIAVVGGYQWHVLNKSENWITRGVRTEYAGSYVIERPGREILGLIKQISGSVYMIRADLLKKIGWGTSITEDFQLTLKLYEQGYKVIYTPYVQAPAECASTLKRLIRQRMRWAEGHSNNIRRMFWRLLVGHWEEKTDNQGVMTDDRGQRTDFEDGRQRTDFLSSVLRFLSLFSVFRYQSSKASSHQSSKEWIPSPLTLAEKLEVLYLSPYYLQAAFFMVGTLSWLLAETVFRARLPFWTSLWGWSLVLTNLLSLPLVNAVGLFLEESEEKDYLGILSFIALSYIMVPFQAYASIKGFIEKEEGPWFRTPKTGRITDVFTRGRFYRWISGILPGGRPEPAIARSIPSSYLALTTANNQFNQFKIPRRRVRWVGRLVMVILLVFSMNIAYFTPLIPLEPGPAQAPSGSIIKGNLKDSPRQRSFLNLTASPAYAAEKSPKKKNTSSTLISKATVLFSPQILDAFVDPDKVKVGDVVVVQVKAKDFLGVRSVVADMGGIEEFELRLVDGTRFKGTWRGEWKAHDTESKWYETIVKVTSFSRATATALIKWSDPVYTWDGSDSTNWFTGANWDQESPPGDTDDVVIDGNYISAPTINAADTIGSLKIGENNTSVLTFSNNITLTVGGDVTVYASGTITHTANTTAETHKLTVSAANIDIQSSGKIDVNGKGYTSSEGTGTGIDHTGGNQSGSGAGYGGTGGRSNTQASVGTAYVSLTQPANIGSGGGNGYACSGGAGGGAIKINVTGTLDVDGSITADGNNGGMHATGGAAGGGSGGSIWLIAGTIDGTGGSITANGGIGPSNSPWGEHGGGGAGGRIAIEYTTDNSSLSALTAYGGSGYQYGGAGTVYQKSTGQSYGDLTADNGGNSGATTPLLASFTFGDITLNNDAYLWNKSGYSLDTTTYSFTDVIILNDGTLVFDISTISNYYLINNGTLTIPSLDLTIGNNGTLEIRNTSMTLNYLTIQSGGTLTHTANTTTETYKIDLTINNDMSINSGGEINLTSKGYSASYGDGKGTDGVAWAGAGGGGHGGDGGNGGGSGGTKIGGGAYDSLTQPILLGSGGGNGGGISVGGRGGGAVKIDVTGILDVDGSIVTNGTNGTTEGNGYAGGGGSGGSVYITTSTLTGDATGSITANGGAGGNTQTDGGGGAGGRIAIEYTADTYSGSFTATGGWGYQYGGAGTIYQKSTGQSYGDLTADNGGNSGATTPMLASFTFDDITLNNDAYLWNKSSYSLDTTTYTFTDVIILNDGTLSFDISTISNYYLINNGTLTIPSLNLTIGSSGTLEIKNTSMTLNYLTIQSGGNLTHTANGSVQTYTIDLTINNDMDVQSSGTVNVNGKGYTSSEGLGAGIDHTGGNEAGSGAGYGGNGGRSSSHNDFGEAYGSESEPANIGSGGGNTYDNKKGGKGGGTIKIDVSDTLTINGSITANGTNGEMHATGGAAGGGSGGSIWLIAGIITGSGTGSITTNGGIGPNNNYGEHGGGGAGGRIAYYYTTDSFSSSGTVTADGGSGYQYGEDGTIIPENLWLFIVLAPFLPKILRKRLSLVKS